MTASPRRRTTGLRSLRTAFGALGAWLALSGAAFAQTAPDASASPFSTPPDTDRAFAWINFLFDGTALPDGMAAYGHALGPLAAGLRHALGLYNIGMLTVGGLLLFYHLIAMIVDTAHSGVVLGRRANKVWGPLRLVLAVGLLVPVGGGLSAGQYMVIKIARTGSDLASNAWQTIVSFTGDSLSSIVPPRAPDVAGLVAASVEMEICRLVYQQAYTQALAHPAASDASNTSNVPMAGPIGDISKWPADRLMPETWRYSNALNASASLCGEYRFTGYRPYDLAVPDTHRVVSDVERATSSLFTFAHLQAEGVLSAANGIAARVAPHFLDAEVGGDIRNDVAALIADTQTQMNDKIKAAGLLDPHAATQILNQSSDAGWLAAADIIPGLLRLQESYGETVAHALPVAGEPLFDHPILARQTLLEGLSARTPLLTAQAESAREFALVAFYNQVSHVMAAVHAWVDGSQMPKGTLIAASSLDLRDHLGVGTDAGAAFGMFAAAFDAKAIDEGVWGGDGNGPDGGNPFTASAASLNPFTTLAEFGRRQYRLGAYLMGLSGSALGTVGAVAPAALTAAAGAALFAGGLALIFVVPFLPFFRFMIAALIWALNLFEAVAAMPVVALAHLTPNGEGLSGSTARQAYRLWLALMIRPLLTLLGFVLGFLFFAAAMGFFTAAMASFAHVAATSNGGLLIIANAALVLMFDVFAYAAANAAFKGIHWLPEQALRWISSFTVTEGSETEPLPATTGTAIAPLSTAITSITNLIAPSVAQGSGAQMAASVGATAATVQTTGGAATTKATNITPAKSAMFPSYKGPAVTQVDVPPIALTTPSVTIQLQERERQAREIADKTRPPALSSVDDKQIKPETKAGPEQPGEDEKRQDEKSPDNGDAEEKPTHGKDGD